MRSRDPITPGCIGIRSRRLIDGKPYFASVGSGDERGIALIIVLWVVLIVSVIAMTYMYEARTDIQMMGYSTRSLQAYYVAKAGMARAMILLREDILKDEDVLDREYLLELDDKDVGYRYDGLNEAWFVGHEGNYDEVELVSGFERDAVIGKYTVNVIDESSKVNLNFRGTTQDLLKELLLAVNVDDEEEAQAMAAAIIDWRDPDDQPSDGGDAWEFGDETTESTYYNPEQNPRDIERFGPDYVCKNEPYGSVEELLLVKGMTSAIFLGEDANGNGELDDNEDDGDESYPPDNADGELQLGLRHYVTVDSQGPVNLNTASEPVLRALLALTVDERKRQRLAEDIVDYRLGGDREPGGRDDKPLRTLDGSDEIGNTLTELSSFEPEILSALRGLVTVSSDTFTIVSTGEVQGARRVVRATVFREFREKMEVDPDERGSLADRRRERGSRRGLSRSSRSTADEDEIEPRDPRDDDQGRIYTKRFSEERIYGEPVTPRTRKRHRRY
jgi:type II secretory pathway component PulK